MAFITASGTPCCLARSWKLCRMYDPIKKAAACDHRTMAGWVKALIANALEADTGPGTGGTRKR
jgi:hypothetical protein